MNTGKELEEFINNYPTKYPEGFMPKEVQEILKKFPKINMKKFYDALCGNTCTMREGELTTYHCDLITAIRCGVENRDIKLSEWD